MSHYRTFTRSIIVLFILGLSFLMAGCDNGSDDGEARTIDSTVTIEASSKEVDVPLTVKFRLKSDDLILRASWNFGDGDAEVPYNPESSIKHTYQTEGTYTASVVTETNSGGAQTDAITITVGGGILEPVTTVFLVNLLPDLTLYSVVGNSSAGDTDFKFRLQESDPDNATPGLIEPGEVGFIEVKCDMSWGLGAFFTDGVDPDVFSDSRGMELYSCGVDYEWVFIDPEIP